MKKKLLLFLFIFLTFGKLSMASSSLPNGAMPNERLMGNLRGAIRFLNAYFGTNEKIEDQNDARRFINGILGDPRFSSYVPLAFDDTDREDIEAYNRALSSGDHIRIKAIENSKKANKILRKQFGL